LPGAKRRPFGMRFPVSGSFFRGSVCVMLTALNLYRCLAMSDPLTALHERFRDVVKTEEELREVVGHPLQRAIDKVQSVLDDVSRAYIAHSPFLFIASASDGGVLDISPKGDPRGFVEVLDERTLAIPDRLGNRRVDTFRNVLRNPQVGLIFVIPGITYTLRVSGTAIVVRDAGLRERMTVNGRAPNHVMVVSVSHVLTHCPKCMIRSGLWEQARWPDTRMLPTFAEALIAHAKLQQSLEEVDTMIETGNRERLY